MIEYCKQLKMASIDRIYKRANAYILQHLVSSIKQAMQAQDSFSDQSSYEDDDYQSLAMGANNDLQNQSFTGEKDIKKLTLSPAVLQYFTNFKKYSKSKFTKLFSFNQTVQENKSVCAKSIQRGQTIAECYDCATDSSCIQCMECFKGSNHEGHKVVIKKAYGGCCDCGDVEAWKKEGFCKRHTGEAVEVEIDEKEGENFLEQMKQVFFLLFRECIQENRNFSRDFSDQLLSNLCYLNSKGVYYNKLTTLLFTSTLPPTSMVSTHINSRTILANLLSPRIVRHLNMDKWMQLFFSMFQYYPFKKLLLSTYMSNFSLIYSQRDGMDRGASISCQLLTSYQLVREYALEKGTIPMGEDIDINKIGNFDSTFLMLYHDLTYITKLQGDTPLTYFKFHTHSQQGILKLFQYRKIIKNQQDKHKQQPDILQLARFVKYFMLEFKALELVTKIAGILRKEKERLRYIIKVLHEEAVKEQSERKMVIFRPLTRALAIFLFAYFDLQLNNITYTNNTKHSIDTLVNYIGNTHNSFADDISKLFATCVQTYLFHAKILAQSGLNSTLYGYIYYYKLKSRIVSCVDGLSVKMLGLMHGWPQVGKVVVVRLEEHIWQSVIVQQNAAKKQQLQLRLKHMQFMLSQLNLASVSSTNQVHTAYQIDPQCGLYQEYIQMILLKLLKQEKTSITLANVKQWSEWFFHPKIDLAQHYLKRLSTYDKVKKAFIYNAVEQKSQAHDFIDYHDFRCNITNRNEFVSPQVTLQLIRQSGNEQAYDTLWSVETIKNMIGKAMDCLVDMFKLALDNSQSGNQNTYMKLRPLFNQLMKTLYLKKQITQDKQQIQLLIETTSKAIPQQSVHPFYQHNLLHPQKIQQQKPDHPQSLLPIQPTEHALMVIPVPKQSPKKMSQAQCRKNKLKQKLQMKKSKLRQKYQKQTGMFQQQQKLKLQTEDLQQQLQHKLQCIICKSDQQQHLVYLVNITYQNYQKLLGLGDQGVTCLSLSSCYHALDYACYKKLQSEIGNRKKPVIKCPFCKIQANTFLPIKATSKLVGDALERLEGALFTEKNFDEVNITEEIIKSFYHFALLAYLDPQKTLHRRLRVYKIVFEILKQNTKPQYLQKIYTLFTSNKMNLNPVTQQQLHQKKRAERLLQLTMDLQHNNSQISLQDLSEGQVERLLNMMSEEEEGESGESANSNFSFSNVMDRFKQVFSPKKKTKTIQKQQAKKQNKMSSTFKLTMNMLFNELNLKVIEEEKKQPSHILTEELQQQINMQQQQSQLNDSIELCFKRLFDPKFIYHHNNIYQDLNDNNNLLKLRDLPINFKPLGLCNKCQQCGQISSSITLCLLCDWQGCLRNCLSKRNVQKRIQQKQEKQTTVKRQGGTFNHSKQHGEQSLFLILQNCQVAKITVGSQLTKYGCIYKDEWGNDFHLKQKWENYFLDEGELNKAKLAFLHQQ